MASVLRISASFEQWAHVISACANTHMRGRMSAEPKAPYSDDLRWRVVWQRIGMGLRYREIANCLNIAVGTAHNIFKLFERTGSGEYLSDYI